MKGTETYFVPFAPNSSFNPGTEPCLSEADWGFSRSIFAQSAKKMPQTNTPA